MTEVLAKNIFQLKSSEQIIEGIQEFCHSNQFSFAAWRMPNTSAVKAIIDFATNRRFENIPVEELHPGFLCTPFKRGEAAKHIHADIIINFDTLSIEYKPEDHQHIDKLTDFLEKHIPKYTKSKKQDKKSDIPLSNKKDQDDFKHLVSRAIEEITSGYCQKIVPSRVKLITLSEDFSIGHNFLALCETYQNAFVSLSYIPGAGYWMGATPELLIETNNNTQIFKTVSLAGTQKYNPENSLSDVAWTQKEIEEQAFVSRYIINCFKKIRLREFEEIGPKTVRAGNLIHLKTVFSVDMAATNFPQLGSVMLDLLHPTSAVCGMPLEASLNFLSKNEKHNRKLFSGYIGPVNIDNQTSLFVNLRCMHIFEGQATLYAGAGITEDSNPEKEWLETEMKMNTLLNVIR